MDLASTIDMKALGNINRIQVGNDMLMLLLSLYESKGKTFYYDELFKKDFKAFYNKTLEEDIIEIAEILELEMTDARIRLCSRRDYVPKTKDEQLLLNLKKTLKNIQDKYDKFEILANEAHELSKMLAKNYQTIKWNMRESRDADSEGIIKSSKKVSAKRDLEELVLLYTKLRNSDKHEIIHLVVNFYLDFINLKIFNNKNELVAFIFLYTILFKNFPIFSYVSFFKHYRKSKESWEKALIKANYNWDSSYPKTEVLSEILLEILISAYEEVDDLANQYEFEKNLNKSDSVENTILKFDTLFAKEDLRNAHPTVSDSTIDRTLRRLRDEKKIMPIGTGRSAKWQVLEPIEDKKYKIQSIFTIDSDF